MEGGRLARVRVRMKAWDRRGFKGGGRSARLRITEVLLQRRGRGLWRWLTGSWNTRRGREQRALDSVGS